jgi:hypothetical protein
MLPHPWIAINDQAEMRICAYALCWLSGDTLGNDIVFVIGFVRTVLHQGFGNHLQRSL